ncbi:XRE family transcriptional regulator [Microbaculum marinisediminis]|uniref:HTH cro/C1-type domain-containing protein n=1 Tax=Microbaculum marinisediminis TaxID=2931392 RepID=A0AAW5QW57_9HYPH|nr:LexA family transcriptional regulator [Microbaculum sp. A6E488]MCT8970618.1 hypothetical protein [Microbaculum sp. A6E488]
MSKLGKRVAARLKDLGHEKDGQTWLAKKIGMRQQGIQAIIAGRSERPRKLLEIARALQTTPEYLVGDTDDPEQRELTYAPLPESEPDWHQRHHQAEAGDVANLSIRGGLGLGSVDGVKADDNGELYADQIAGYWSFPDTVKAGLRNLKNIYALPVIGDSMEPALKSGSFVFVDMSHTVPQPEDIYACDYGDGLSIKRLQLIPRSKKIRVISDNERYQTHELLRDDVRVYGRVVAWFQWRG